MLLPLLQLEGDSEIRSDSREAAETAACAGCKEAVVAGISLLGLREWDALESGEIYSYLTSVSGKFRAKSPDSERFSSSTSWMAQKSFVETMLALSSFIF